MSSLNHAIQLIRQGQKEEARQILESLLKAEPGNIQVWLWYVDTCSTQEKRIQALETCLKMNPGNSQILQALQLLRSQQPPQPPFTPPADQAPKPARSEPLQTPSLHSAMHNQEPKGTTPSSNAPIYVDDKANHPPAVTSTAAQQPAAKQKKAWEEKNVSYVDNSMLSKGRPAVKSYTFYDAWMTVLARTDIESYESVLNDPEAGAGRAFEWVAYAGIISGLIFPFSLISNPQFIELIHMPEFEGLFGSMGTAALMLILALAMALLTPVLSVIGLAISAGIQNFLAVFFGGNGYYGRTVYALAAYLAPMTIIIAALSVIPLVGQCLTSLLGLYNIILNLRALRAAHSISSGQALAVIFAPGFLMLILGCMLFLIIGMPSLSS